jgi:hypothetical protein
VYFFYQRRQLLGQKLPRFGIPLRKNAQLIGRPVASALDLKLG